MGIIWSSPLSTPPSSPFLSFQFISRSEICSHMPYGIYFISSNSLLQWTSVWPVWSLLSFPWILFTPTYGLSFCPICDYSESVSNVIAEQLPQFIHWHVWRFVHSPCLDRGQIFLGGVIFGFHHSHMASILWQAEVGYSFLMGSLGPSIRVYGGLSGQYLDSEGLGLIQATHFNLPRAAVPGNSRVTMKCKLDQSCSSTGSCEFPGFGPSSSPNQLLIGRSSWAPSLAWGQLSFQRQVFRYMALALLVWTV